MLAARANDDRLSDLVASFDVHTRPRLVYPLVWLYLLWFVCTREEYEEEEEEG